MLAMKHKNRFKTPEMMINSHQAGFRASKVKNIGTLL
jgi:hypothetical protein